MGTRTAKAKATVVNMFNAELGGEKAGLTTKDVVEGLAKKRKKDGTTNEAVCSSREVREKT